MRFLVASLTVIAMLFCVPSAHADTFDKAASAIKTFADGAKAKKTKPAMKALRKAMAHLVVGQELSNAGKAKLAKLQFASVLVVLKGAEAEAGVTIDASALTADVAEKLDSLDKAASSVLDKIASGDELIANASRVETHGHGWCVMPGDVPCSGQCCSPQERCGDGKCHPRSDASSGETAPAEKEAK